MTQTSTIIFTVESAIQSRLIARNEEALTDLRTSEQSTLRKSRRFAREPDFRGPFRRTHLDEERRF